MGNEGWEHRISDIYGIHDYAFDGSTLRERYGSEEAVQRTLREGQHGSHALLLPGYEHAQGPIMLTEVGGISMRPASDESWYGYGSVADCVAFFSKSIELIDAIVRTPA